MSASTEPSEVARAFEMTGGGWVLEMSDRDDIIGQVAREIDEFIAAHKSRFGDEGPSDPFELLEANPSKAAAFFQTFTGATISTEMRVMVWEVLLGADILAVEFDHDRRRGTRLRVTLNSSRRSPREQSYASDNLWDFQIFRHFGLLGVDGVPILDGYYALSE